VQQAGELSREKAQRQRLAEELVAEERNAKARVISLERQIRSKRRVSNSKRGKFAGSRRSGAATAKK
jgi:hypothetical protein